MVFVSFLPENLPVMVLYTLAPNATRWEMERNVDVGRGTCVEH